MAVEFHPLPPEHPLAAAGAAILALGESRLLVHAHRLGAAGDVQDEVVAEAYAAFIGFETRGNPWPAVPATDLLPALSALVSRQVASQNPVVEETVARDAVAR